jgi:homoprotocatechuate degradation regulator HpaR
MRTLEQSLPLKLLKAREAVMEQFRPHLNAHGVTEQQWRVLRALAEVEAIDIGTLSQWIALSTPSLSRMLPDMEARGLIKRRKDKIDGRVVIVLLAPKGRDLFERMSSESERIYHDLEEAVGRASIKALTRALDKLIVELEYTTDRYKLVR